LNIERYDSFFAGVLPVIFFLLAGLDFPKEPLNVFPFLVFLSPLPIDYFLLSKCRKNKAPLVAGLKKSFNSN